MIRIKPCVSIFWRTVKRDNFQRAKKEKPPCHCWQGGFVFTSSLKQDQPQEPPQEPELQLPPPPSGLAEVIEKPERYPASMKSTLTAPHLSRRESSTKNFRPPSSNILSLSFDSSRAKPKEGPLQPPCIKAMRIAELILFCSRYDLRLLTARAVTSNIHASSKVKKSPSLAGRSHKVVPSRVRRKEH